MAGMHVSLSDALKTFNNATTLNLRFEMPALTARAGPLFPASTLLVCWLFYSVLSYGVVFAVFFREMDHEDVAWHECLAAITQALQPESLSSYRSFDLIGADDWPDGITLVVCAVHVDEGPCFIVASG